MNAIKSQLEAAMQNAWDAGCDPFEDARVLALLDEHPQLLEGAARWRRSVRSLQQLPLADGVTTPTAATHTGTRFPVSMLAAGILAAGALAAGALFFLWPREIAPNPVQPERPQLRVLQSSLTQRFEYHGSACSVREERHATPPPESTSGRLFLASRLVRRTQTSLTR